MKCPKCGYHKPPARKKESIPVQILAAGEVHSQLCGKCDERIYPGETCWEVTTFPAVYHVGCVHPVERNGKYQLHAGRFHNEVIGAFVIEESLESVNPEQIQEAAV